MTSGMYNNSIFHMSRAEFTWTATPGSVMYCALTVTTQPDQTHAHYSQIVAELSAGSGYTVGGGALTLIDSVISGTDPTVYLKMDAVDTVWTTFSQTCQYAISYAMGGGTHPTGDATMPLFSFHDFGSKTGGGGNFTVVWDTNGVARIQITDAA